ncbi:hypothetical protein AJ80_04922 [Polytolypa hystricis UAMH7299]|uniref:Cell surface spherulin 4-like protein n=1 Tax=Polytolypa hystricis (strain UAMH7299) TaxID=1447883 RepID=A0A2B7Y851_POLH7|nr:hypothetical protein AJ80_04922 [Polytolypa hystricis UAMH7299]
MVSKPTVFVPLYVYPAPGAWSPLIKIIHEYRDVEFTVVVNPGSGPGPDVLPDSNYLREIPTLTVEPNVHVLGYVATNYANRPFETVQAEVARYADWPSVGSNPALALDGIFFDETPQAYNPSAAKFLEELSILVKCQQGFGPSNIVVHNPGTVPEPPYLTLADGNVVFEGPYDLFCARWNADIFAGIPPESRSKLCCIIHSVPRDVSGDTLKSLVSDVRSIADEVFITHLSQDYYASFGSGWSEFVNLMASSS